MKEMLDNSESFTAYATIAAGYYMIEQAQKKMDRESARLPIERLVDAATGYDKQRLDDHKRFIAICLIDIIEAKKVIDADYTPDADFLAMLNNDLNGAVSDTTEVDSNSSAD